MDVKAQMQSMTPEQKQTNLNTLNYIKNLAASSSIDISSWNILEIFGTGEGLHLASDKKVLNKKFFDHLTFLKSQPKSIEEVNTNKELNENAILQIKEAFISSAKTAREAATRDIKANMDSYLANISRLQKDISTFQTNYSQEVKKYNSLTQVKDDLEVYNKCIEGFKSVINDGLWINPIFYNGKLYLNTSSNIMLHEVNKSANLDIHIDFGQLAVELDIQNNFNIRVIPYKNNIMTDRVYHPHVFFAGNVCWGEASLVITKHITVLEFDKVLRLLHSLLHNYNADSPVRRMADFKLYSHRVQPSKLDITFKHPEHFLTKEQLKPKNPTKQIVNASALAASTMITLPLAVTTINATDS